MKKINMSSIDAECMYFCMQFHSFQVACCLKPNMLNASGFGQVLSKCQARGEPPFATPASPWDDPRRCGYLRDEICTLSY